jgi:hypothetical protein
MQGMQPQPEVVDPKAMPRMATPEAATSWVETNLGRKATQEDLDALKYQGVMGNTSQRLAAELAVVDLYTKVLGRPVDDEAREEYTNMYMKNPARVVAALYRSEEANQKADQRFFNDAKKIAEEKGITLPDDFAQIAKQNNPWRNLAVGYKDSNRTKYLEDSLPVKQTGMAAAVRTPETKPGGYYKLPLYVQQAGAATFLNEEDSANAAEQYSPEAVVNQYAKSPADFYKDAAANAYADIWLLKTTHPTEIEDQLPAQVKEMADLEAKYRGITDKATALGVTPEDISAYTGEKMKEVGSEYEKWYNDEHSDGFMNFLMMAGVLVLGAAAFAKFAAAGAGTSAGAGAGAGTGAGAGYSWAGTGANLMAPGVYSTGTGVGLPMFSNMTAAQAAAAMKAGTSGTSISANAANELAKQNIFGKAPITPNMSNANVAFQTKPFDPFMREEILGKGAVQGASKTGLMDYLGVPKEYQSLVKNVKEGTDLVGQLTGKSDKTPSGGLQQQRVRRDVSTLIPNSVTMIDPTKWAEMTTSQYGGLNMMRGA